MSADSPHEDNTESEGMRGEAPAVLRISLRGDFRVTAGDGALPATAWKSRKAALLVTLLGHALHREEICDRLWSRGSSGGKRSRDIADPPFPQRGVNDQCRAVPISLDVLWRRDDHIDRLIDAKEAHVDLLG